MRRGLLACVLALAGCGPSGPIANGVFDTICTSDGVRHDASGATAYTVTQAGVLEIRNGQLVEGPCATSIHGFDGESFDLGPNGCDIEPGVVRFIEDGAGTLKDGMLTFKVWATIDRFNEGVTYEFTSACEGFARE